MKKLLLLFLLIAGGVSTASADGKKIYLANNWDKSNVWVGVGDTQNDDDLAWTQLDQIEAYGDSKTGGGSNYSHSIYEIDLGDHDYFHITYTGESFPCLSSSDFEDGGYYKFNWDGANRGLVPITLYTYNFNIITASSYESLKIYPFYTSATSWEWKDSPTMSKSENVYTYSIKTIYEPINVILYTGSYQTCTLTASSGTNNYFISTMTTGEGNGEFVKTNSSGYSTFVNGSAITMSSGIAYVAEDKGTWAQAYNISSAPASTPMLIKGNASTTYHFAKGDASSLPCTNAFVAGSGSGVDGGSAGAYNYILKGDAFYRANGNSVASTKAYLQLSEEVPAGSRAIVFDDVTGINAVNSAEFTVNCYYDLQGCKVAQPTKGLYIINGRKVVIK